MDKETAKRVEALILGMDMDNLHLISHGPDWGGVNISFFYPELAVKVKNMLLELIREDMA